MFQAIVHFNQTHVLAFDSAPTGCEIKTQLFEKEGIPAHFISLICNGDVVDDDCLVTSHDSIVIRAVLVNGICGGKGGFGAQLRALAKQKAHIKTVDFGACRDLSGRRLRHVNDEILLHKWKEAKEKGESFEADGETPTGIDLWYLSAPSWAEGVKVDKRKIFMKPRMKTSMCIDWKRAREHRPAPDGAPAHWGCPRGRRCEFAHGLEELRGEAQVNLQNEKLEREQNERNKKRDDYMGVLYRSNKQEEELEDLVLTGLRAAKKAKMSAQDTEPAALDSTAEDSVDATVDSADVDAEDEVSMDYFTAVAGTVVVAKAAAAASSSTSSTSGSYYRNNTCPIISGTSAFATVVVDGSHIVPVQDMISSRSYYYEVELYSDGLMQLGWADQHFITALASKSNSKGSSSGTESKAVSDTEGTAEAQAEDGVGDCAHSWGYDGYRQQKWHSGEGTAYGPQTGAIWKTGDVVGCLLELSTQPNAAATADATDIAGKGSKKRKSSTSSAHAASSTHTVSAKISYTVNGVSHGQAFEFALNPSDLEGGLKFFPALSLENEESVLLNVGNAHFKHAPSHAVTSVWETITGMPLSESNSSVALAEPSVAPTTGEKTAVSSSSSPAAVPTAPVSDTTVAAAPVSDTTVAAAPAEPIDYAAIALEDAQYGDVTSLEALGLVHLKQELERRGLKTGGTLVERAQRLFSVRGLAPAQYDSKLLAKKK